jgi:hypothetical protein
VRKEFNEGREMEIFGRIIGVLIFGIGFVTSLTIRNTAKTWEEPPVSWGMLELFFYSFVLPPAFSGIGISGFHLLWLLPVIYVTAVWASSKNIPILSQIHVWSAYLYVKLLMSGTGMTVSSPKHCSPWAGESSCREAPDFHTKN